MDEIKNIINLIDIAIKEDPGNLITWGNIISDNYDSEVDKYRGVINTAKDWLTQYQSSLVDSTGISTLKIKYTEVSGYFIEIPKSQLNKIPSNFVHKQTLVNAWRFITEELKEFEWKLLEAEGSLAVREYELFLELREKILESFKNIKEISEKVAFIDFSSTLAEVAYMNNYSKPVIIDKNDLEIVWGRHPVIEKIENNFISNDLILTEKDYIHIITWPNMWWKSTFLRQNALIILMAHIWSFVSAKKATIPLTDRIFSRVWATDNLFLWQSTFMVEMQEIANILNNSSRNSFVIIDEVGRWTSTYDGMSLAWAILKENHDNIKAKTLFATHYHELIDESEKLKWVSNYSVAVSEDKEDLIFLRKIIKWWIKKSFWLEVAKIAWVPANVIKEARNMLQRLEKKHNNSYQMTIGLNEIPHPNPLLRSNFEDSRVNTPVSVIPKVEGITEIEKQLLEIDVNNLTPMEALNKLSELKWKIIKQ